MDGVEVDIRKIKCVLLGDGAVGKTSLIVSYTTNGYPADYVPTAFDNYSVIVGVNGAPVQVQLCDTAGQDDFDALRPLCYPGTDVFLLCFSVVSPTSLDNVRHKWLLEVHRFNPGALVLLVGLQSDRRSHVTVLRDLAHSGLRPISEKEARAAARSLGAAAYFECSALTQQNLKEVFDTVITAALSDNADSQRQRFRRSSGGSKRWSRSSSSNGGGRASTSARPRSSLAKTPSSSDMSSKTLSSSGYGSDSTMLAPVLPPRSSSSVKTRARWRRLCCLA